MAEIDDTGGAARWWRRGGRVLRGVALVFVWAVVPLVVVEGVARFVAAHGVEEELDYRATSVPGLQFEPRGGPNRLGFRTPDHGFEREAGVYRVAVLGDSVTFGSGVAMGEAFAAVAEARLNVTTASDGAQTRYAVINAGVPSYNTEQVEATYLHRLNRYVLDHVIYVFHPGDVLENIGFDSDLRAGFGVVFPKRVVELGVLPEWLMGLMRVSRVVNMVGTALVARSLALDTARFAWDEGDVARAVGRICAMGVVARGRGEKFTLALIDDHVAGRVGVCANEWECVGSGALLARVGEAARGCGVPVLDLTPVLRDAGVDTFLAEHPDDRCHPNAAGHALLGAALARHIEEVAGASNR